MIVNTAVFEKFEREQIKKTKPDYFKSLRIFEALWKEAENIGALPLKNPLDDMEADFKMARILNSSNV